MAHGSGIQGEHGPVGSGSSAAHSSSGGVPLGSVQRQVGGFLAAGGGSKHGLVALRLIGDRQIGRRRPFGIIKGTGRWRSGPSVAGRSSDGVALSSVQG